MMRAMLGASTMSREIHGTPSIPEQDWGTELELGAPAPGMVEGAPADLLFQLRTEKRMELPQEHLCLVPREVSEHFLVAALRVDAENIEIAMADPNLDKVVEELEFATGKHVVRVEMPVEELREAIDRAYAAVDEGTRMQATPRRRPTSQAFMKAVVRPDYL